MFWSKGYDGVTIDDLVAGMGVGRPSLYAVFGDKRTLFLRVLKDYAEKKGARAAKALLSPPTLRDSLAGFLRHAVESCDRGRIRPGMSRMVCVAPLVDDAEVRQFLQGRGRRRARWWNARFRDGISAGEIPSDFPVAVARAPGHRFCPRSDHACADGRRRARRSSKTPRKRPTWCSCRGVRPDEGRCIRSAPGRRRRADRGR